MSSTSSSCSSRSHVDPSWPAGPWAATALAVASAWSRPTTHRSSSHTASLRPSGLSAASEASEVSETSRYAGIRWPHQSCRLTHQSLSAVPAIHRCHSSRCQGGDTSIRPSDTARSASSAIPTARCWPPPPPSPSPRPPSAPPSGPCNLRQIENKTLVSPQKEPGDEVCVPYKPLRLDHGLYHIR